MEDKKFIKVVREYLEGVYHQDELLPGGISSGSMRCLASLLEQWIVLTSMVLTSVLSLLRIS